MMPAERGTGRVEEREEEEEMEEIIKGRTCSDSIRAFRISSLLFEIGILSSPSLFVSSSDSEIERSRVE